MRPDRNNFAPRIGFAWKPFSKTVVRGGYGINYNTGAYQGIAQQLAFQPPFSTTATNIQTDPGELTLQSGFPPPLPSITNSYAVNPNYRLGYVQIRNLDIQQQIRPTLLLNIDYTGTKGTDLDILEAPNRTATGIRIPGVEAFTYENSVADSEANAGSVRLRKRLSAGFSIGGIYTFSKSLDDASSIGAGATSGRARRDWVRAVLARAAEAAVRRAEARPTLRRILSIYLRSAGFPASTRRISSPRIIYGSYLLVTTSAGSREILRCAPFSATGNGAAIGRSHPGCRSRRDCWATSADVNRRNQRHAAAGCGSRAIGEPGESFD